MKRFGVLLAGAVMATAAFAQTGQTGTTSDAGAPVVKKPVAHRKKTAAATHSARTRVIPMETAPASTGTTPATAAQAAQQRAADQQLLQQQQAQSDKAAQINTQQVDAAQRRQDRIQNETRQQDAPGPAQTGVIPGVPPSTQPVDQRSVQEAPGPAQTLPQPVSPPTTPQPANPPQ